MALRDDEFGYWPEDPYDTPVPTPTPTPPTPTPPTGPGPTPVPLPNPTPVTPTPVPAPSPGDNDVVPIPAPNPYVGINDIGLDDVGTNLPNPPAPGPGGTTAPPSDIIGRSGYNYGPGGTWQRGQRPPSNEDWLGFTDEERRRILGDVSIEEAREYWQETFQPGGANYRGGATPGGGAPGGTGVPRSTTATGADDWLTRAWNEAWNRYNQGGPYGQTEVNRLKAQAKATSVGTANSAKELLGRDLARRGLARSAYGADRISQIDEGALTQYSQNVTATLIKAVEANYAARTAALQQALQVLQMQQQAALAAAKNQLDRDIANANIALGYARIQATSADLQASLQNAYALAQLNNNEALIRLLIDRGIPQDEIDRILDDQRRGL